MPWPSGFPPWQQQDLNTLSSSGQLSGLNPLIIAGIEEAETGGWSGGAINTSGYGGYFGLSTADGPTAAQLNTGGASSPPSAATDSSYQAQAIDAARIFATQLKNTGGNVGTAEGAYQSGHASITSGSADVLGVLGSDSPGNPTPSAASASGTAAQTSTAPSPGAVKVTGLAGVLQQLNQLLNPQPGGVAGAISGLTGVTAVETYVARVAIAIPFLMIAYFGFKIMSGTGGSSGPSIMDQLDRYQKNDLAQQRIDTAKATEEARSSRIAETNASRERIQGTKERMKSTPSTVAYDNPAAKAREARLAATNLPKGDILDDILDLIFTPK